MKALSTAGAARIVSGAVLLAFSIAGGLPMDGRIARAADAAVELRDQAAHEVRACQAVEEGAALVAVDDLALGGQHQADGGLLEGAAIVRDDGVHLGEFA